MKTLLRWLVKVWFRFSAEGAEALETPGPVLLAPNHVSWLDWLFLGVCLPNDWRFATSSTTAQRTWIHRRVMVNRRTFPIDAASPYAARRMAEYLATGGRLVLFAEGRISDTGSLMKLFEGTGFLLQRTRAKVVLCQLRGAERVRWVNHGGWRRWRPRVSAHFKGPMLPPTMEGARRSVARARLTSWLRDQMVLHQFEVEQRAGPVNLLAAVVAAAREQPSKIILEDSSWTTLNYRRLLLGAAVLKGEWLRLWGVRPRGAAPERIGFLLPNVNAAPVTLLSLWAAGRSAALLNFSAGVPSMIQCARIGGVRRVVTSRSFLERARLDLAPFAAAGLELVYLEDIRQKVGRAARISAWLASRWRCGAGLAAAGLAADDTAAILFTSGSEGAPKGVELTHGNVLANVRQALAVFDVEDNERFFNALPLFHSFGLGPCLMLPLMRGLYTFLYPSPLHYRVIPQGIYDRHCTVMVGTNTFLNGYARKAHPYDFHSVKYLIAGGEKLQEATYDLYLRRFGVRALEGYGATECSPVVTINTRVDVRPGSVGRFLPGIDWRLEPVEGAPEGGRLWVRGPNVMKGYTDVGQNARFLAGAGWYDTGDLASVDADGFVHLLGRLKRFVKISGEMVSLTAVEEALAGAFPQFGARCEVAVVARPDVERGEALVAFTNEARLRVEDLRPAIQAKGLSNLAVPRELQWLREIPKLGSGKVDHRQLIEVAGKAAETAGS